MPHNQHRAWGGPFGAAFEALKSWLEIQPRPMVWRIVVLGMAGVFALDFVMARYGVRTGPLYLLPICLACWRLSFRAGLCLGVVASILVAGLAIFVTNIPVSAALGTLAMNVLAIGILGGIVASFRHSVEHERFLAGLDHMTGALTKPAFERRAEAMLEAAAAEGRPLLLAYLDLDGFKAINDQHGHEAGDELLKRFALAARAALRREDCFGRVGGDEFAILMPLSARDSAQAMAGRLHRRLTVTLGDTAEVTCSMGALNVPPAGRRSLKELLREADRVMYAAKRSGKNAVQFATYVPPLDSATTWLPGASGDGAAELVSRKTRKAV